MRYAVTVSLAEELFARGRSDDVARMLDPLHDEDTSGPDASETGAVRVRLLRARLSLLVEHRPRRAARLLEPLRALTGRIDPLLGARIHCELGWLDVWRNPSSGQAGEALGHLRTAARTFCERARPRLLARALLGEALACRRLGSPMVGASALREAAVLVPQLEDTSIESWWSELRRRPEVVEAADGSSHSDRFARELRARVPVDPALAHASEAMRPVVRRVAHCAAARHPVLLIGERGTGRRDLARAIHRCTDRPAGGWTEVEAAPHVPGTGTAPGAPSSLDPSCRTIYLSGLGRCDVDRIERLVERWTGEPAERSDSGVAGPPLVGSVRANELDPELRSILEHRFPHWIEIPPLRRRTADVSLMARHYLRSLHPEEAPPAVLTERALRTLIAYPWPGNLRQLRNELERALAHQGGEPAPVIDAGDLAPEIREAAKGSPVRSPDTPEQEPPRGGLRLRPQEELEDALARSERRLLEQALEEHEGHVASAARRLGLTRQGLYKKMKRLDVERRRFVSPSASADQPS